ncbi:MAG: tetratricopeptide repeat protein, partial [Chloroflexota bacterium]
MTKKQKRGQSWFSDFKRNVQQGKLSSAVQNLTTMKPQNRIDAEMAVQKGAVALKNDAVKDALTYFDQAITHDPRYALAYNQRGVCYFQLREFDNAQADFEYAVELAPDVALFHTDLSTVFLATKQYDEAIYSCSHALNLAPELSQARRNRVLAYFETGDLDNTMRDIKRLLAKYPNDAQLTQTLGLCQVLRGEYLESIDMLSRTLKFAGDSSLALSYRALAYIQ